MSDSSMTQAASLPGARRQRLLGHWAGDFSGGMQATLGGVPVELNYGLITLAPLGVAYGSLGIMMAFLGCIVAGCLMPLVGGVRGVIPGSRPGIALILAHLVATLMADPALQSGGEAAVPTLLLLVLTCCALAGLLQIAFGLAGLGRAIRYLPYPVLSGLMAGIAILMFWASLKPVMGLGRHDVWPTGSHLPWLSLVVAAVTLWVSFHRPRRLKAMPPAILALLAGTLVYYLLLGLAGPGWLGPTLPALSPQWPLQPILDHWQQLPEWRQWLASLPQLLPFAATMAVLATLESLLCAVNADQLLHCRQDSRQVLLGHGLGTLGAALLGGTTVAGTAARLVANVRGGGRTAAASGFYALGMGMVFLFGLPLLGRVPEAVTAALLIVIAVGMVDDWLRRLLRNLLLRQGPETEGGLRRQQLAQAGLAALVALTAVFLGLLWAVGLGVVVAMVLFVRNNSRPVVRRLLSGALCHSLRVRPGSDMRWLETHGEQIALVELQGSLFFGTADRMQRVVEDGAARWVILDFSRVTEVDATGVRSLQQLTLRLEQEGRHLLLAHVRPETLLGRQLAAFGLPPGPAWFPDADSALESCENALLDGRGGASAHDAPVTLANCLLTWELGAAEVAVLSRCMERHLLCRGSTVFAQGDAGGELYLVIRGTVSIRLPGRDGYSARIAAFGPGVVFGEMSFLEGKPRSAAAVADEDVELLSLSRGRLDELQRQHPAIAARLVRNLSLDLADRLRLTTAALMEARP